MTYPSEHRGEGSTTAQLLALPSGSVFVVGWVLRAYTTELSKHLGLSVRVMTVEEVWQTVPGTYIPDFDVDHSTFELTKSGEDRDRLERTMKFLRSRVRQL